MNDLIQHLHLLRVLIMLLRYSQLSKNIYCTNLQRRIYIVDWAANNKLVSNINKYYVISMTRKAVLFASIYTINGQLLKSDSQIKD